MARSGDQAAILGIVSYLEIGFPDAQAHHHPMASLPPWRNPTPAYYTQPPPPPPPPGVATENYHRGLQHYYPPGLIRVSRPFPAPVHVVTNETASLFGDFARYLDTGRDEDGNKVIIDLDCMICMEHKLRVPACVSASHDPPDLEGPGFEGLTILPCGHYLGSTCLERWLGESEWSSSDSCAACPLCRLKLRYPCGHYLAPRELNPIHTRRHQVPLTLPEGGEIPENCPDCHYFEIMDGIDNLRNLLFPRDIGAGDFVYPDSREIMHRASTEFCRNAWRLTDLEEHYNRW
ncbi:hypothetical protein F5X97DRAFT_339463 [Nemania serpens]|nr:hypothetical protein F5X97DRAFT_339463 [Nemania serpens]